MNVVLAMNKCLGTVKVVVTHDNSHPLGDLVPGQKITVAVKHP